MPRYVEAPFDSVDLINAELDALERYRPAYVTSPSPTKKSAIAAAPKASPVAKEAALSMEDYSDAQLTEYFERLFKFADADENGTLDIGEMESLLSMTGFAFTKSEVQQYVTAADTNGDGVIDYEEFVPMMMSMKTKPGLQLANYTDGQLTTYFKKLFQLADTDGNGVLDLDECTTLLSMTGFNLSTAQISSIVHAADINGDGVIEYGEFVPMIVTLL